jgi:alpha-tubulin suppressor-like RCC1 family protein
MEETKVRRSIITLLALFGVAACSPGADGSTDLGVDCERSLECASDVCLPVDTGRRVCTAGCTTDSECTPGWSCDSFGGVSGRVCVCRATAEACDGVDDDCDGAVDEACGAVPPDEPEPEPEPEPTMDGPGPTEPEPEPMVDPCLASQVDASVQSSCAVGMDGDLYCWGGVVWSSEDYDLGYYALAPEPVIVGEDIVQIADGGLHLCALTAEGRLLCRGENQYGQLGVGHRTDIDVAEEVPGEWAEVSTGYIHSCGIKRDGTMWCWGYGNDGALGSGDYDDRLSPAQVGSDSDWEYVSAGRFGTCGLKNGGEVWCWGDNWPPADDGAKLTPDRMGTRDSMVSVDVGTSSACAIRNDGALFCWGYSHNGEVGRGFTIAYTAPIQVGDQMDWTDVAVGAEHVCGVRGDEVWCWGANTHGQLGIGTTGDEPSLEPIVVRTDGGWRSIAAQGDHTCALREGGEVYCWGENRSGESGGGSDAVMEPRELCATDWS